MNILYLVSLIYFLTGPALPPFNNHFGYKFFNKLLWQKNHSKQIIDKRRRKKCKQKHVLSLGQLEITRCNNYHHDKLAEKRVCAKSICRSFGSASPHISIDDSRLWMNSAFSFNSAARWNSSKSGAFSQQSFFNLIKCKKRIKTRVSQNCNNFFFALKKWSKKFIKF